ncbi:MAG: V-type ATPase subunit [Sedimentisphaerales bacterium]|nr:V-type ATPase subunit [Sedimentisphaerales bacterium]
MNFTQEQNVIQFNLYPPIGEEDWRYIFATAQVRTLAEKLFDQAFFHELAHCGGFKEAAELLTGTDYAIAGAGTSEEIEQLLCDRRREVNQLICQFLIDEKIIELLRSRSDFANMRLAIRRLVTEKPLGDDYCDQGNIPIEQFGLVFEQEDYSTLPGHLQEAVEAGVLGYYKNKNVRDIDLEIDKFEADFFLRLAKSINSTFLTELFRMQIDLTNIRTMMRLKLTETEARDVLMPGGYIEPVRLDHAVDTGYESLAQLFAAMPYQHIIETGANYMQRNNSFLKLEAACDGHFIGYLKSTDQITAGHQPIVAYLLRKEHEIRMVRIVLACKKAEIEPKVILDRLVA